MKVTIVTGTRPQIIKSAPVLKALEERGLDVQFIHTGQHYDYELASQFIEELDMNEPDQNLKVGSGTGVYHLHEIMLRLGKELEKAPPDYMIVPGDTNSALAAALTGFKMDIPTCHLESGLRSYDMMMQEETSRRLIDHGAAGLFAPTQIAVDNLKRENVRGDVFHTGDTMYDILIEKLPLFEREEFWEAIAKKLGIGSDPFAMLTLHRRENVDYPDRLTEIAMGLAELGFKIVFPMHPRTHLKIQETGIVLSDSIQVIDPVPYSMMMGLVSKANLLLTDSGGLQKEAYLLNTPCVTIRDNTEWLETLESGGNVLAAARKDDIVEKGRMMWLKQIRNDPSVYGTGNASKKIAEILASGEIEIKRNVMV